MILQLQATFDAEHHVTLDPCTWVQPAATVEHDHQVPTSKTPEPGQLVTVERGNVGCGRREALATFHQR